jgi:segregation and condensation protein A
MPEESFILRTEKFEGPLDLLLSLIEKRKLHISDVSLAQIADEYMAHLEAFGKEERDLLSFLSILSTLLLIKARALLPGVTLTIEEEKEISELEHNLERYQALRSGRKAIEKIFGKNPLHRVEGVKSKKRIEFKPSPELTLDTLNEAARALLVRLPKLAEAYQRIAIEKKVRLEDIIVRVMERLTSTFSGTFSSLAESTRERGERVLHFLALLELVRMGAVKAVQKDTLDEIYIERHDVSIPKYGA